MNDISTLPFPFDPACELRKANVMRADLIYQAALAHAERKAREAGDESKPTTWPARPDTITVRVQPVQPSERLLAPSEIAARAQQLKFGALSRFFEELPNPVPLGVFWGDFRLDWNDRKARLALENGLVCYKAEALAGKGDTLPKFYVFDLIEHIVMSVQAAHQLFKPHLPSQDWALAVSVENLGDYEVWLHRLSHSKTSAHHTALIRNWVWNYHISNETFGDEAFLNGFLLSVVEEICWGFGVSQLKPEGLLNLSKQQGLTLEPLASSNQDAKTE